MNRRRLLSFLGVAPIAAVGGVAAAKAAPTDNERLFTREQIRQSARATCRQIRDEMAQHRRDLLGIVKDAIARAKKH